MAIDKITATGLGDGGVSTADLADGAVTTAKVADASLTLAKLSATGTKNNTTFLRGDNSFQVVAVTPTAVSDQANTSTGSFDIPSGTTAQRPSSPANGMIRFNTTTNVLEYYDSNTSTWWGAYIDPAKYTAEWLVIAGGGAGGYTTQGWAGGGGGAGGVAYHSGVSMNEADTFTITVGAGATAPTTSNEHGSDNVADNGGNSSIAGSGYATVLAYGGGGGAGYRTAYTKGSDGGSGGGGEGNSQQGSSSATRGTGGTTLLGNAGGAGSAGSPYNAGGGGGAGSVGLANSNGGAGTSDFSAWGSATSTGENVGGTYWYAGGGGGGNNQSTGGTGGNGGAGNGGNNSGSSGTAATDGTGGGGGGRGYYNSGSGVGGDGGNGIVIIRYRDEGGQRGSGGTITQSGGYYYHKFTSSGTFTA